MKIITGLALFAFTALASITGAQAADGKISVVAAENFYGDVARQIGGDRVAVSSIMSNPDEDPHLFETTPAVGRSLAAAQIVVFNGADYDPWMAKLLKAAPRPGRVEIVAADLVHKKAGDNPHLWYDPPTMPAVARALADALGKADAAHAADYQSRLRTFVASLEAIHHKIAGIKTKYAGKPATATEPVFGYMAAALGLKMRNGGFQLAVMNDTEPSAKDMAAFESDLKNHKVAVLFYNKQVTDKLTEQLLAIARKAKVPVVGVTETEPAKTSFQDWMLGQLSDTEKALAGPNS
jgi:zinc/manganese transport system substrate-binding protein